MSKTETSSLTGFDGTEDGANLIEHYRTALETLRSQGFCTYGQYPWDFWEKRALARGVRRELAGLGRAVMREANQHTLQGERSRGVGHPLHCQPEQAPARHGFCGNAEAKALPISAPALPTARRKYVKQAG